MTKPQFGVTYVVWLFGQLYLPFVLGVRKLKRLILPIVAIVAVLCQFQAGHTSEAARTSGVIASIEAATANGQLSYEAALLYKVRSIVTPERLPSPYRELAASQPIRCGTPIAAEAMGALRTLSPAAQSEIETAMARPSTDSSFVSPKGYFRLHYDLTGANSVSSADNDSTGFPDFIENLARYLDSSWTYEVDVLGWRPPPSDGTAGGDSLYDVYPTSIGFTYGITIQEAPGPEPWDDYSSYVLLNKSFLGFPPNDDPDGNQAGSMKVTCAHEFNHACQFATSPLHFRTIESWWQEISATWIEDVVFDPVNDNYNYIDDYLDDPTIGLADGGIRKYGAFIFAKIIEETSDTVAVRNAWELMRWNTAMVSIDSALFPFGSDLSTTFSMFTEWNYFTGSRDDGLHYSEGSAYPLVPIQTTHGSYPILNIGSPQLQPLSSTYIRYLPDPMGRDVIAFQFNGSNNMIWRPTFVRFDSAGVAEAFPIPTDPVTGDGVSYLGHFDDMAEGILIGTNADWPGSSQTFQYSIRFLERADCDDDADADIFDVLHLIECVFDGGPAPLPTWQVGDLNCSGGLDILDVSVAVDYILKGGEVPCSPFD